MKHVVTHNYPQRVAQKRHFAVFAHKNSFLRRQKLQKSAIQLLDVETFSINVVEKSLAYLTAQKCWRET